MAFVRRRGNHLAIVHGERDTATGKVVQRVLMTLLTQAEARDALGQGSPGGAERFRASLESDFPSIPFDWDEIRRGIENGLSILPAARSEPREQLADRFRADFANCFRHLAIAAPMSRPSDHQLLQRHEHELRVLADVIVWRLGSLGSRLHAPASDPSAHSAFDRPEKEPSPDVEEFIEHYIDAGNAECAQAGFGLLVDTFGDYAEGYNYLGRLALEKDAVDEAIGYFEQAMRIGRRKFPKRIAKNRYWADLGTRAYVRALRNLALALNIQGRSAEVLGVCERLEKECGDASTATSHRATAYLNAGQWSDSFECSRTLCDAMPTESLVAAFALYELGAREEAAAHFLHAALNEPQVARLAVSARKSKPTDRHALDGWNEGEWFRRSVRPYLRQQSPRSRRYFGRTLRQPQVQAMLDELRHARLRARRQHVRDEREAFDRVAEMCTLDYARERVRELAPSLGK